jgi:hypothetical protein
MEKVDKSPLWLLGFLQGFGVVFYCSLVALLMANGNKLFGRVPDYLGPFLFLTLFSTSALICAIITLYFPFILFFQNKRPTHAVRLVVYTAGWLFFFTFIIFSMIILSRS